MSKLETALTRLSAALGQLEKQLDGVSLKDGANKDMMLQAERDALLTKVRSLEAKSAEDAQLRGEAAQAVRAALSDLRAMAANGGVLHG
ncbi:hypothetical protein KHP62_14250 [Rhodobacteraceae bacterium NNCM2]|nr:hypothetical protein [Coraliihabitans acroporae]